MMYVIHHQQDVPKDGTHSNKASRANKYQIALFDTFITKKYLRLAFVTILLQPIPLPTSALAPSYLLDLPRQPAEHLVWRLLT